MRCIKKNYFNCIKCGNQLVDIDIPCSNCGMFFDYKRKNSNLTEEEYKYLSPIDQLDVLINNDIINTTEINRISDIKDIVMQLAYHENLCTLEIKATFVGMHVLKGFNNKSAYYLSKTSNTIMYENEEQSLYPIFRYEYNGKTYIVEEFDTSKYSNTVDDIYIIGEEYNIYINPDIPEMMVNDKTMYGLKHIKEKPVSSNNINNNNDINNKLIEGAKKGLNIIKLVPFIPFVFISLVFIIISIGLFINDEIKTQGYLKVKGELIGYVDCQYDIEENDEFCNANYLYIVETNQYTITTKYSAVKEGFKENVTIRYEKNNPSNGVVIDRWYLSLFVGGMLFLIVISLIFLVIVKKNNKE